MNRRYHSFERWKVAETGFKIVSITLLTSALATLFFLILDLFLDGSPRLDWNFITGLPSRFPENAGILPALVGTLYLVGITILFSFPIGIGTALYLEEYSDRGPFANRKIRHLVEVNLNNLAAVPSIVFGLLGLVIFVRYLALGQTLLAGGLTLAALVMPIIFIASREAIRAVPHSLREASYALGATRWQTIYYHVLPSALPGILSGTILAVSRAIGEAAPLLVMGAYVYISFVPEGLDSPFTALPVQIFSWLTRPQTDFQSNAAAAILVLLPLLLMMNGLAIWLRDRNARRNQ
jgi:phosphate transport system permease protein